MDRVPPCPPHLWAPSQHQVTGLADKHAPILHQFLAMQEGEAAEEMANLALPALEEKGLSFLWPCPTTPLWNAADGQEIILTEWGPSMTLTMSFTWMLFCSESRATAKRLSFFRVTAWCLTVTTFPYMFSTCRGSGGCWGMRVARVTWSRASLKWDDPSLQETAGCLGQAVSECYPVGMGSTKNVRCNLRWNWTPWLSIGDLRDWWGGIDINIIAKVCSPIILYPGLKPNLHTNFHWSLKTPLSWMLLWFLAYRGSFWASQ